jgi:hypothetical protein
VSITKRSILFFSSRDIGGSAPKPPRFLRHGNGVQ